MYRQTSRNYRRPSRSVTPQRRSFGNIRLILALGIGAFALFSYFIGNSQVNEITGETQRVGLTEEQEIALGQQSAPEMVRQHGGISSNEAGRLEVEAVGQRLVRNSIAADSTYQFQFHLLADPNVVNAFALPGGPIFITEALYQRLESEGQLAGVLGHEIGHVIERHSAERIAKQQLTEGLLGAVVAGSGSYDAARAGQVVGQLVNMNYGREDELESDQWGIDIMCDSGYNPHELKGVMRILASASGGQAPPEFMSTHPNPDNRIERIDAKIASDYPNYETECVAPEFR